MHAVRLSHRILSISIPTTRRQAPSLTLGIFFGRGFALDKLNILYYQTPVALVKHGLLPQKAICERGFF